MAYAVPDAGSAQAGAEQFAAGYAALLLANGETTEGTRLAMDKLGLALGMQLGLLARWDEVLVLSPGSPAGVQVLVSPLAVDIGRVAGAGRIADMVADGQLTPFDALARLDGISSSAPVSLLRFATMAAAGAGGLGVIFGAAGGASLAAIGASAALGACLRRGLSHLSANAFLQPFAAATLAGLLSALAQRLGLPVSARLVAVCPCMVLVPGPHFLNGAIDLVRVRIPLGLSRLAFAGLIVLAISAGLLLGLQAGGRSLVPADSGAVVPLAYDVCAAGVAVAAYGSFFNMPWRMLPLPIAAGMTAHAFRWLLLSAGFSVEAGAFAACLLVGSVVSPLSHRTRIPFAAFAFASVVSLIPGVFLFQAVSEAVALVAAHPVDPAASLLGLVTNGTTSCLVLVAMTMGLIVPKLCLDQAITTRQLLRHRAPL